MSAELLGAERCALARVGALDGLAAGALACGGREGRRNRHDQLVLALQRAQASLRERHARTARTCRDAEASLGDPLATQAKAAGGRAADCHNSGATSHLCG